MTTVRWIAVAAMLLLFACQAHIPTSSSDQSLGQRPAAAQMPAQANKQPNKQDQAIHARPADSNTNSFIVNRPKKTGFLQQPELVETSGLASSTLFTNTFWAINDGGNAAKLYAFNRRGQSLGEWQTLVKNKDWEDLASARINGKSYLFVADIGDNARRKDKHVIHVFEEPNLNQAQDERLSPIHKIKFRYPDRKHNAESLAVSGRWLYILTKEPLVAKKRQPSRIYRIPISLSGESKTVTAEFTGLLAIPPASLESNLIASLGGIDVSQPTAFDIDQQNRVAYVLTYRGIYRYERDANQGWGQALAQPRVQVHSHALSQAEALTIDENGVVWFTSENRSAPIWALPAR